MRNGFYYEDVVFVFFDVVGGLWLILEFGMLFFVILFVFEVLVILDEVIKLEDDVVGCFLCVCCIYILLYVLVYVVIVVL